MDDDAMDVAGTRAPQVCQGCRVRHKKCDWERETCQQCESIGLECVRQPAFRFRYDPMQKASAAASSDFRWTWTLPKAPLTFHDETAKVQEMYAVAATRENPQHPFSESQVAPSPIPAVHSILDCTLVACFSSPSEQISPDPASETSPAIYKATHPFTPAEAVLIRNYVSNMALWSDATDPCRSFEHEVPRRALTEPLLRHAICAFSARHFYRGEEGHARRAEALDHQTKCLELLILAMSGGQCIDESVLTAVAVLRQNEEMEEDDNRFHLEGISRILNMVPDFAAAGGLGEAAAWLCLREDIYVSLTTQSPIKIGLECFSNSASIRRGDDYSWANKMILILAQILNRAFSEPVSQSDIAISEADIADWDQFKPASYQPIHFAASSQHAARPFPEIWMLAPHHVVGLQYFHIAQIVLSVMKHQQMAAKPYSSLFQNRSRDRHVRRHLRFIVGLAVSNELAENTWFTARHCLSVWAGCLRKRIDQEAAIQFLKDMDRRTGWTTTGLIESLRGQWNDDSESE